MIFIVVKQPVRPKYADDWPDLVRDFTSASRDEPGCIFFDWYRSVEDPNVYLLVEAFRDAGGRRGSRRLGRTSRPPTRQLPKWLAAAPEIVHVETPGDGWSAFT